MTLHIKYIPSNDSVLFHFFHFFLLVAFSIRSAGLQLLNSANACQDRIVGKCREIIAYKLRWRVLSMTTLYMYVRRIVLISATFIITVVRHHLYKITANLIQFTRRPLSRKSFKWFNNHWQSQSKWIFQFRQFDTNLQNVLGFKSYMVYCHTVQYTKKDMAKLSDTEPNAVYIQGSFLSTRRSIWTA